MPFLKQHSTAIALGILTAFTFLLLFLAQADSLTYDERAHIPAAYSYVRYGDIRLNPEHPPLLKDMAGFPLIFLPVTFPIQATEWVSGTNEQWVMGDKFLNCTSPSEACNNTMLITFWARLPLILVAVSLGVFLIGAQLAIEYKDKQTAQGLIKKAEQSKDKLSAEEKASIQDIKKQAEKI